MSSLTIFKHGLMHPPKRRVNLTLDEAGTPLFSPPLGLKLF